MAVVNVARAVLTVGFLYASSTFAISDMLRDLQQTYSKFTSYDEVEYTAQGLIQPVWYRYSDDEVVTMATGDKERVRLQINGTPVHEGEKLNSDKALKATNALLSVEDGTLYCDEMASKGCPIHIKVGNSEPFVAYGKPDGEDFTGKVMILDKVATSQLLHDIRDVEQAETKAASIYIDAPFFVVGQKPFKFGLLKTSLKTER